MDILDEQYMFYNGATVVDFPFELFDKIGKRAFYHSNLTSVTITDNITEIGEEAFAYCDKLVSVTLGTGLTRINDGVFSNCHSLTSITIPENITAIGKHAFAFCENLTNIKLHDKIEFIHDFAFQNCPGLKDDEDTIKLPISLKEMGDYAMYNSKAKYINTESLTPASIKNTTFCGVQLYGELSYPVESNYDEWLKKFEYYLGYYRWNNVNDDPNVLLHYADGTTRGILYRNGIVDDTDRSKLFNKDTGITSIEFLDTIVEIGDNVVSGLTSVTAVTFPNTTLTKIGKSAFMGCTSLKSVTIPNSVSSIDKFAFSECDLSNGVDIGTGITTITEEMFSNTNIKNINLNGSSVMFIENRAFSGCDDMQSINLSAKLKSIGSNVFDGCSSLTKIETMTNVPANVTNTTFQNIATGGTLYYPAGATDAIKENYANRWLKGPDDEFYLTHYGWNLTERNIFAYINQIGYTLDEISRLDKNSIKTVSIHTGQTVIPDNVFSNCIAITSLRLNNVQTIGKNAFRSIGIKSLEIPSSVTTIEEGAFSLCSYLNTIVVSDNSNLSTIGEKAFESCSNLKTISITSVNKVPDISENTFLNVHVDGELSYDESKNGFEDTWLSTKQYYLGYYNWNKKNTNQEGEAKEYVAIINGENMTYFEIIAMDKDEILTVRTLKSSYPDKFFSDCPNLTEVYLNNMTSIPNGMFSGCTSLTKISDQSSIVNIGISAFEGCTSLTEYTVNVSLKNIQRDAFKGCINLVEINMLSSDIDVDMTENPFYGVSSTGQLMINKTPVDRDTNKKYDGTWFKYLTEWNKVRFEQFKINGRNYTKQELYDLLTNNPSTTYDVQVLSSVKSFEDMSIFANKSNVKSIDLNNVTTLGVGNFSGCTGLENVINGKYTSIPSNCFQGCTSLRQFTVSNSTTEISDWAFNGCSSLSSVTFNISTLKTIGSAFSDGCGNLKEIILISNNGDTEPTIPTINKSTFSGVGSNGEAKTGSYISDIAKIKNISTWFDEGYNLREKDWKPSEYGEILYKSEGSDKYDVMYCLFGSFIDSGELSNATDIIVGEGMRLIPDGAFSGNTKLTSVTIGDSKVATEITSLGNNVFSGCTSLKQIIVNVANAPTVTDQTFKGIAENGILNFGVISDPDNPSEYDEKKQAYIDNWINGNNTYYLGFYGWSYKDVNEEIPFAKINFVNKTIDEIKEIDKKTITDVEILGNYPEIEYALFSGCTNLTSVTIDSGVITIGDYVFKGCQNLVEINLNTDENIVLGNGVFESVHKMGILYLKGKEVDSNNEYYFTEWLKNEDGYLGYLGWNGLENIAFYAKVDGAYFRTLDDIIKIPKEYISSVTFLNTEKVVEGLFSGCTNLTSVTFSDSINEIEKNSFKGCTKLTSVTLNFSKIKKIGESAFDGTGLKTIKLEGSFSDKIFQLSINTFANIPNEGQVLYDYSISEINGIDNLLKNESLVKHGWYPQYYYGSIIIYHNNTSETFNLKYGCIDHSNFDTLLEENNIEVNDVYMLELNNMTFIGENTFANIINLEKVIFTHDSAYRASLSINKSAFNGCKQLTTIMSDYDIAPLTNGNIEEVASSGTLKIPHGSDYKNFIPKNWDVKSYDFDTDFSVIINNSENVRFFNEIPKEYFKDNTSISSITIGDGITYIPDACFSGCTNLTNITLGDGITVIPNTCFSHCTNLTNIILGDNITTIGKEAFEYTNITSIVFPENVTSIGMFPFYDCTSLTEITIKGKPTIDSSFLLRVTNKVTIHVVDDVYKDTITNILNKGNNTNYEIVIDKQD